MGREARVDEIRSEQKQRKGEEDVILKYFESFRVVMQTRKDYEQRRLKEARRCADTGSQ